MKNNRKKIPTILFISLFVFLLSGCFNLGGTPATTTKSTDERTNIYETDQFTLGVPKEWEVIKKDDFTAQVPPETVVVFRNNVKNENFTANVNIVKNNLQESTPTLEYAKMVNNRQKSGLYNYKLTQKDTVKINIGGKDEDTFFTAFEAKKGQDEKLVKYVQTYAVKGNSAYIITGSMSPQENGNTAKLLEDIVKSFKLK